MDRSAQVTCDDNFHIGFNRIYDRNLAASLSNIYKRHEHLLEGIGGEYQLELAANCKTIRDFDDAITRVSFGWPNVDAYYAGEAPLFCLLAVCILCFAESLQAVKWCRSEHTGTRW